MKKISWDEYNATLLRGAAVSLEFFEETLKKKKKGMALGPSSLKSPVI